MEPVLLAWVEVLERLHADFRTEIIGRSIQELDWRPGDGANSLAVLAAHVAGSERYWIGDVVMGESSGRDRDSEFTLTGVDGDALLARLDASLAYSRAAIGKLRADQLGEMREVPGDDRSCSVAWALDHILEHTALHLGHMQVTTSLMDERRAAPS